MSKTELRIRALLFPSIALEMLNKNFVFFLICFAFDLRGYICISI
jgi:hypothetical protein